ncbi:XRE family transcriptional regulator [Aeromicrobium phragmitis]|uniref:XRE family transcriptional regulator n=1 Tax=Aeromicrobium phragmitis TaxID=2478914 RepID=A0A3L8PLE2_9ACTN|nr:XRE family transcriptional regulator [Aeromicrobium phragmitis]RLV56226.1 XRE family transcriptional regulator [Aeromicrobium phragmitis]
MSSLPQQPDDGADMRAVASRIRSRRQQLGLTLQDVAERSDVSKSYLSQVETAKLSPSLGTLERISAALRLPTKALMADPGDFSLAGARSEGTPPLLDRRVFVTRKDRRKTLGYSGGAPLELLTPDLQRQLEVTMTTDPPDQWRDVERFGSDSEEFVFVLDGDYEVMLDEDVHHLKRRDSMYFYPTTTYRVRAVGSVPARAIWVALPPVF